MKKIDRKILKEAFCYVDLYMALPLELILIIATALFVHLSIDVKVYIIGVFLFGITALLTFVCVLKELVDNYNYLLWCWAYKEREKELELFAKDDFSIDTSLFD